jgi:hypothetical protein
MTESTDVLWKRKIKTMSRNAVFAIYPSEEQLAEAIEALRTAGIRNADVSVLLSRTPGNKDLAHEKNTKAPEGAAAGAATGAIVGGALGWLVGIGMLAVPGIGPLLAAGPIMAALSGAGAVGAVGGIGGALIGSGMPEYEAKRYDGRVRTGGALLSVHCENSGSEKQVRKILEASGGEEIASAGEAAGDYARAQSA